MSSTSTDSGRPHSLASLEERERVDDLSILTPREKGCYMVALSQELTNAISLSRKARGVSKAADGKKNSDVHEKVRFTLHLTALRSFACSPALAHT